MRIFYDVDTQNDFMNKTGALYVPNAELIKPNLKLLTDFARKNKILIIGSVDRHFGTEEYKEREGELAKWGGPFPDHCMNGTFGQEKILETNQENYQNLFFEKQSYDVFTNPTISAFLKESKIKESIVYGVATDYCVKAAVLGMQQKGI
ncbi:MAG: cysteine hydrolase family protein, partial [Nanoarchaeota archaeon]